MIRKQLDKSPTSIPVTAQKEIFMCRSVLIGDVLGKTLGRVVSKISFDSPRRKFPPADIIYNESNDIYHTKYSPSFFRAVNQYVSG